MSVKDKKMQKEDLFSRLAKKKGMAAVCKFAYGPLFPILLGALVLSFYSIDAPIVALAICLACGGFVLLFAEDTRPLITVIMLMILSFRYKYDTSSYLTKFAFVVYAVFGTLVLFGMGYRLLKKRVAHKNYGGLIGMGLLGLAFLVGGIFSSYYDLKNFGYSVAMVGSGLGCFAFFAFTLKKKEDNILYFARVAAVVVCIIALQILEFYLRNYTFGAPLDGRWKSSMSLGWSISNMVAEMIVFLLPAVYYLVYKEKNGYLYWLVAVVGLIGAYFTLCRNSLLWGGLITVVAVIVNCIGGKNKKINRWLVVVGILLVAGVAVILTRRGAWDTIAAFFKAQGIGDDGRFKLWRIHFGYFSEAPLNGVGFQAYAQRGTTVTFAHNQLVQMLASTGVIGFLLYFAHRSWTVYTIFQNPRADRLFLGGCIGTSLLIALLSPTFFLPYSMLYYSIMLVLLEKSEEEELPLQPLEPMRKNKRRK